ncbi:hypothetical protein TNCV_2018431 [Trichonephila clavipes]|nr:hypothetical protein TNCV_2018431 [Trichonephila clavipes]
MGQGLVFFPALPFRGKMLYPVVFSEKLRISDDMSTGHLGPRPDLGLPPYTIITHSVSHAAVCHSEDLELPLLNTFLDICDSIHSFHSALLQTITHSVAATDRSSSSFGAGFESLENE